MALAIRKTFQRLHLRFVRIAVVASSMESMIGEKQMHDLCHVLASLVTPSIFILRESDNGIIVQPDEYKRMIMGIRVIDVA